MNTNTLDQEGQGEQSSPVVLTTAPAPEKVNWVKKYNDLVAEAEKIGLQGYKTISSHFRDAATGAKRCAALESSIRARRQGLGAADQGEVEVTASSSVEEEKGDMSAKKKANGAAKRQAKPKTQKEKREGIAGELDTRQGTNLEKVCIFLWDKNRGKAVERSEVARHVYGNKNPESISKLGHVLLGVEKKTKGTPYKLIIGDEGTLALKK